jgi:hypothetical protein
MADVHLPLAAKLQHNRSQVLIGGSSYNFTNSGRSRVKYEIKSFLKKHCSFQSTPQNYMEAILSTQI